MQSSPFGFRQDILQILILLPSSTYWLRTKARLLSSHRRKPCAETHNSLSPAKTLEMGCGRSHPGANKDKFG